MQARSRERVAKILAAAAALLDKGGIEAVTTNAIARRARVPVGSLYQFFPNREAILGALAEEQLAQLDARLEEALAGAERGTSLHELVRGVIATLRDAYVSIPGLAALVGSTQGRPDLERLYDANNRLIIARVAELLASRAPSLADPTAAATMLVEASDAVLRSWLRGRARGREAQAPAMLAELERMLAAYLGEVEREHGAAAKNRAR